MARRVPVLLQMSTTECGAACLAMVLSYFGRATTVSECHDLCGAGRDGATAKTIVSAARALGLTTRAFRAEPNALAELPLPAILHVDFNHFVVLERIGSRYAHIVDPSGGRARVDVAALDDQFTGVVLTFAPTEEFEPRAPQVTRTLTHHLRSALGAEGVKKGLAHVLGASVAQHVVGLGVPAITAVVFDRFIPEGSLGVLDVAMLGLTLLVASQMLLAYLRGYVLAHVQARLDAHLMVGFFGHLLSLPLRYFEERTSGDLLMRIAGNTSVRDIIGTNLLATVLDGTFIVGYFGLLLWLCPPMGLVTLAAALVQGVLLMLAHEATRGLVHRELSTQAASQGYLIEALKGVRTLKASGAEDTVMRHWAGLFVQATDQSQRRGQRVAGIDALLLGVRVLAPVALLWTGAHLAIAGALSIGGMWAAIGIATAALAPTASLIANAQKWMLAKAELDRIAEALGTPPEQAGQSVGDAPALAGAIECRGLRFRYAPTGPLALDDVSMEVPRGAKVAIVGRSGSGKSTLLSLLLGLYEAEAGDITYDGRSLSSLCLSGVRRQVGVVTQDAFVFSGSIRDNIAFGDPTLDPAAIEWAASVADLHRDIESMPMGYETLVGEGGIALSGGQRQRMAIARAVVAKPSIVMLDEATSQLDTTTEARIMAALRELRCTCVVVAHRLSTVRDADTIFVMDGGAVIERGRHEQLMHEARAYAALVHGQVSTPAALALVTPEFPACLAP